MKSNWDRNANENIMGDIEVSAFEDYEKCADIEPNSPPESTQQTI